MESKGPKVANKILKEKFKIGRWQYPTLRVGIIKTVWYWQKNKQISQWSRLQSPEVDPHK